MQDEVINRYRSRWDMLDKEMRCARWEREGEEGDKSWNLENHIKG